MPSRPCVVLVDPSTGIETFISEFAALDVGLIVVSTENSRQYPNYFQRPRLADVDQLIDCDSRRFLNWWDDSGGSTTSARSVRATKPPSPQRNSPTERCWSGCE